MVEKVEEGGRRLRAAMVKATVIKASGWTRRSPKVGFERESEIGRSWNPAAMQSKSEEEYVREVPRMAHDVGRPRAAVL